MLAAPCIGQDELGSENLVWNPQERKGAEQDTQGDRNPHFPTHTEVSFGTFSKLLECPLLPEGELLL